MLTYDSASATHLVCESVDLGPIERTSTPDLLEKDLRSLPFRPRQTMVTIIAGTRTLFTSRLLIPLVMVLGCLLLTETLRSTGIRLQAFAMEFASLKSSWKK